MVDKFLERHDLKVSKPNISFTLYQKDIPFCQGIRIYRLSNLYFFIITDNPSPF